MKRKLFKKKLLEPERTQEYFKDKYPNYKIGKNTYGVPIVFDWHENSTLKIANYCSISANVKIYLGGHHRMDWIRTYPFPAFFKEFNHIQGFGGTNGDVIIGSDVCIYTNVIILSGVHIGNGAVIANGSVVVNNVADYEIVGGNTAKHIRYRFESSIIDKLLKISWWNLSESEVFKIAPILMTNNINNLIKYLETKDNE